MFAGREYQGDNYSALAEQLRGGQLCWGKRRPNSSFDLAAFVQEAMKNLAPYREFLEYMQSKWGWNLADEAERLNQPPTE